MFGTHVDMGFNCVVVYLYVKGSLANRKILWELLTILDFTFGGSCYIVGDFNETLDETEQNSGFLNSVSTRYFHKFLSTCNLLRVTCILGLEVSL